MARVLPLREDQQSLSIREAFEKHVNEQQRRIHNMNATLAHSKTAFEVYMQWYVLYGEVEKILGKRLAPMFAYAVSHATECPLCSTFFRKILIDSGEPLEKCEMTETERKVILFGASIGKYQGHIADHIFNPVDTIFSKSDLVTLVAFAGQMIATNVFNNVIETDLDDNLLAYLPPVASIWKRESV